MKKTNMLNQPLSAIVAGLGHTDTIAIVDSGYPVPDNPVRLDLALRPGIPRMTDVLKTVLEEVVVEEYWLAGEAEDTSPQMFDEVTGLLAGIRRRSLPHAEFKEKVKQTKAVIRSGEQTFFSNVILVCGVAFGPQENG